MQILKRNGEYEEFNPAKIDAAIIKAMLSVQYPIDDSKAITDRVVVKCKDKISVEQIQELVIAELPEPVKTAYSEYRKTRKESREIENILHLPSQTKLSANAIITLESRYLLKNTAGKIIETPDQLFDRVARYVGIVELYYNYLHYYNVLGKDYLNKEYNINVVDENNMFYFLSLNDNVSYNTIYGKLNDMEKVILGRLIDRRNKLFNDYRVTLKDLEVFSETIPNNTKYIISKYAKLMKELKFIPNSPTLMNAGTKLGELSACFVLDVPDSIDGIFDALKYQAKIHKAGGGTGFSFSSLRSEGSVVGSTKGVASGAVSFMELFDKTTDVIKQGGKRRGANMGVLRYDHPEILKFITAKDQENTKLSNFNISVAVDNKFFDLYHRDGIVELKNEGSNEVISTYPARKMMQDIVHHAWLTGDPGLLFMDKMNENNPVAHIAEIKATNPCVTGDTLLYTSKGMQTMKRLHTLGYGINPIIDDRLTGDKLGLGSNVFSSGIKPVYKLKTKEGYYLKATDYHPIFSEDRGKMVELKDLKIGEKIRVLGSGGAFGSYGNIKLGRVLGAFIGDGSLSKTKRASFLGFWGDERELADTFREYVSDIAKKELKVQNIESRNESRVGSVALTRLVKGYGVYKQKLRVPEAVFFGSKEMQVGFLQGIFQTDGTVNYTAAHSTRNIRLSSVSEELLEGVQMLLLNFGIYSRIYKERQKECDKLLPDGKGGKKMYHCRAYHDLVISNEGIKKFADEINFMGSVKKAKLAKVIDGATFEKSKFIARVESIEYIGEEEVYDLTEYVSHSLVCNGIVTSNCGEQPLIAYDSCNLGSIDLGKYVINGEIDYKALERDIRIAYHFLDDVVDANNFPVDKIEEVTSSTRKIGLGYMGFADALIRMGIPYESMDAIKFGSKIMKFLYDTTVEESKNTARVRGVYPYDTGTGMRNSTVVTIAPTGTISIIAGCSSGIEPLFALAFKRNVLNGKVLEEFVPSVREYLLTHNLFSAELEKKIISTGSVQDTDLPEKAKMVLKTAMEIDYTNHIMMQAAFQRYCDATISKTINMRNNATEDDILDAYLMAYNLNCKGITVFRDGCKNQQVLEILKDKKDSTASDLEGVKEEEIFDPNCRSGRCNL